MALATADSSSVPSVRYVLLKGVDERGFVFYTNYESRKAHELSNGHAALCFYWEPLQRSVSCRPPYIQALSPEHLTVNMDCGLERLLLAAADLLDGQQSCSD